MPLQNRVTPLGDIVADPHRGLFTGNRGIIHDPATKTLLGKRWSNPAWLICLCEFRGRRREVMGGRSWTELFFREHRPDAGTVAAAAMTGGTVALAATAWPLDRPAAISMIPLAGWLGFATVLAGEVWRRNGSAPPAAE